MASISDMDLGHVWSALVSDHGVDRIEAWKLIKDYVAAANLTVKLTSLSEASELAVEVRGWADGHVRN